MSDTSVNYSKHTAARIAKMQNMTDEKRAELLKEITLSDSELRLHKAEHKEKKSKISPDAAENLKQHDKKINDELKFHEINMQGPVKSILFDENLPGAKKTKEYLIPMYAKLKGRHANYEKEKEGYTAEQLAVVEKLEKESGGKVKFVVDTNFLKAFGKLMGIDYRGAAINGKYVVVGDPKDLASEPLLRHEAIHCAQQRNIGMLNRTLLSFASSKRKQFLGKEKFTPSAVDYGTDNQATDLETYMNQFNPDYLPKRKKFGHRKYYSPKFLQQDYKRVREQDMKDMKNELEALERRQAKGKILTEEETERIEGLKSDIHQFEKVLVRLENDKENRVVLIEPDVLASKSDKNSEKYDERAQVWTESETNRKLRQEVESGLKKRMEKILAEKQEELKNSEGDHVKTAELQKEIKEYEAFLKMTKGDRDKSRAKSKQDRKAQQEANTRRGYEVESDDTKEEFAAEDITEEHP